jgi:hypothetical protein
MLARVRDDNAYATIEALRGGLDGNPLAVTLYARLGLVDHMLLYFERTSWRIRSRCAFRTSTIAWSSGRPRRLPR